jgi:hypothetical protein
MHNTKQNASKRAIVDLTLETLENQTVEVKTTFYPRPTTKNRSITNKEQTGPKKIYVPQPKNQCTGRAFHNNRKP